MLLGPHRSSSLAVHIHRCAGPRSCEGRSLSATHPRTPRHPLSVPPIPPKSSSRGRSGRHHGPLLTPVLAQGPVGRRGAIDLLVTMDSTISCGHKRCQPLPVVFFLGKRHKSLMVASGEKSRSGRQFPGNSHVGQPASRLRRARPTGGGIRQRLWCDSLPNRPQRAEIAAWLPASGRPVSLEAVRKGLLRVSRHAGRGR